MENFTNKDNELLEEIYLAYRQKIYFLAYRYLHDESLAEDMVGETILKIREKIIKKEINSCHKIGSLIGYIVKGLCVNLIKRNEKVAYREIYDYEMPYEENIESALMVREAIDELPDIYREVFEMKVLEQLSYPMIAEKVGITEPAVRKRMERAKEMMKKIWEERDE